MTNWQPISTARKDGTWIWGFRKLKVFEDQFDVWSWQTDVFRGEDGCWVGAWVNAADCNELDEQPTHWAPLEPPVD